MKRTGARFPAALVGLVVLAAAFSLGPMACAVAAGSAATGEAGGGTVQAERTKVAVFPFEINVERQMGMSYGDDVASSEEAARLDKMTAQLRTMLSDSKRYEVVPLDALSEAIRAAQPLYKCNGCDADLAAQAGAAQAVTGTVQKATETLMNISIFVRDAANGEVVNSMAVSVRQNTDASWLRGVRWLVKNRLLAAQ